MDSAIDKYFENHIVNKQICLDTINLTPYHFCSHDLLAAGDALCLVCPEAVLSEAPILNSKCKFHSILKSLIHSLPCNSLEQSPLWTTRDCCHSGHSLAYWVALR